jgi:hypothetical protein
VPLSREGVPHHDKPRTGPAGHALALGRLLRVLVRARQELEEPGLELLEGRPELRRQHANGCIYLQLLALRLEDHPCMNIARSVASTNGSALTFPAIIAPSCSCRVS